MPSGIYSRTPEHIKKIVETRKRNGNFKNTEEQKIKISNSLNG
jgi:hypothetical protein